ncbi:DUF3800 domain-containing protein [Histidinibacterium lentulum]|uniref:DUF3800 domain-containing protein n=1 Tax=Histidinibacterium lentulum TaxID=2480588 RepID=A0A3N2R885_9RHOB|nr:DUF3800 domain-containing protein [Histidinibacterium lentulum]ROU03591.1 DUF3800 domain-containing protein [Histidinibacterium lentulum]
MRICYIDEAGCTGALPSATSSIQPSLVVVGVFIDYGSLHQLTSDLIDLKQRFYPKLLPSTATHLDWIREEIKGSDIRKRACSGSRNDRRHSFGVLDQVTVTADKSDIRVVGRVWIKGIGQPMKGMAVYTSSIQSIYTDFQRYLTQHDDYGFVVVDSRVQHLNTQVAHSVFTQKFKGTGDAYDRIIELPAFSHSNNHAGLQLADLIASAIVTPIALSTYCDGIIKSIHVRPRYHVIKDKYRTWLKGRQFRYNEASGRSRGGFVVSDGLTKRPGGELFRSRRNHEDATS